MKIYRISKYILVYLLALGHWNLMVPMRAEEAKSGSSPAAGATDSSNKTGVELSLKATAATNELDYNKTGQVVTFTAKDNYAFKSVKTKDKLVWSTDNPSQYATKVVLDGKGKKEKTITIDKLDDNKVLCVREGKDMPWQSFDLSKTNPVSINIGFKSDSFKYTNKLEGETRTFEAKDKFVFNKVRCYINKNWIDIWQTDNENEYSKKVVAEGDSNVTVHLKNGGTKVFNKGSDDIWTEDTASSKKGSGTDGSGGTDQSGGGTTGTG